MHAPSELPAADCHVGALKKHQHPDILNVGNPSMSVTEARRYATLLAASRALAAVAGLIGLVVLAGGWIFDVSALRTIIPGAASMKVNTALGIMLTAGALVLEESRARRVRALIPVSAALLTGLALATLFEDATGRNLGIDELLFADRTTPVLVTAPGRMAVVTAVGFLLLGLSILVRRWAHWERGSQFLAVGAAVLCLANLVGYLYGIDNFIGIAFYTAMAVHTSLSLLMLSVAILFTQADRGLMKLISSDSLGGVLTRRLLPAAVLVPVSLGWLRWQGELTGLYGTAFGLALFATANVMVFAVLIWGAGWRLGLMEEETKQAAALVRAREDLLSIFVKRVPAAAAMLDREMRYLQVSDRWCTDYRVASSELLGRSHYEVFPDIPERWKAVHRRCLAGEALREEEDCWERESGGAIWLRWEIRPWGDRNGLPEGLLIFTEDISERKNEELELRKFVSLADNSAEFIGMCDMNLMPFYANQAAMRIVGLDSLEQVLRTPVPEFFFSEDQGFITGELFPRVVREGRAEVEIRFRHFKTGQPLWMIYNVFYIKDAAGRPVGLATVSRNITERKRAEDELRDREATIRTLLETAAQAILAVDVKGDIVIANRMAGEMFGYTRDELAGRSLEILLPERLRSRHAAHRATFASSTKARPMGTGLELVGMRKDGSEFPIEVSLSHVQTGGGALAVSFVSDITARKRAEMVLQESEQQLRALSGSLITAQEDERRRLSRELHDDITQQLAFLSIELGKLTGKESELSGDTSGRIRGLQEQTLRISAEVRRLSHGLHPSVIEDFGLSIALEEFCAEYAKAQGVTVQFEGFVDDSQLGRTGATTLYRIVQESLRNAVIHGRATQVLVELTTGGESIHLRVQDNGSGFVTDGIRTRTSLGIISMRERIRLVHGELSVSSQPGQGTELTARVPLGGSEK